MAIERIIDTSHHDDDADVEEDRDRACQNTHDDERFGTTTPRGAEDRELSDEAARERKPRES